MVISVTSDVSFRMLRRGRVAGEVVFSKLGRLMKWLRVKSWHVGQTCSKPSLADNDDADDEDNVSLLSRRQAWRSSCPHSDLREGASTTCSAMYSTSRPRLGHPTVGEPSKEPWMVGLSNAGAKGMFEAAGRVWSSGYGSRRENDDCCNCDCHMTVLVSGLLFDGPCCETWICCLDNVRSVIGDVVGYKAVDLVLPGDAGLAKVGESR